MADRAASAAIWAMISEAAITPKPGLVDRANTGSHRDMDFFTLIDSASALLPWFRDCALAGFDSAAARRPGISPQALFESLRPGGREAEALMKNATGGINAHKGYIFCLGILCAAYGRLCRGAVKPDLAGLAEFSKAMTKDLLEDFARPGKEEKASHGETVYAQNGISGIRGEVSQGFPLITGHAMPLLRQMLKKGHSLNDCGTAVLLHLMARAEDTNIIYRGGVEAFRSIQGELQKFLAGDPGIETIKKKAEEMDREFIKKNISPGGCADLLGITFFLYRITETQDYRRRPFP
ncbi:MAG: triphosphoribosyl-dephospho-CoA synthase [Treponema sp.]|nr:triphosphoribosyl-dephospho-CoA synthase [Treponema sp.]